MKKGYWLAGGLVLIAVILIAVFLLLRPSEEPEHPATVIETVNQVDAHPHPKDDWRPAFVDMLIYGGGRVRTGASSLAKLKLLEGVVQLSADSIFTVKKSTSRQDTLVTVLFLEEGRLWAHLTSDQSHEFTIETGNAVAAVRDTRFSIRVTDGETLVSVAEGEVILTAQEQSVTVSTGQQSVAPPGQPPSPPEPMSDEERALWATEGGMPDLAPPPAAEMWVDVSCGLTGPAGDLASRDPTTAFDATIQGLDAAQVAVETPNGEIVLLPPYGDIFGAQRRFHKRIPGLPEAGGTYIFRFLDVDGAPIPGASASDVYIGGHEPDPPVNVQAEVTDEGILVSWDPSPVIPGAFDPSATPYQGFYQIHLLSEESGMEYGWNHSESLLETSHLIPFRRQDFGPDDRGMALEEMADGIYSLALTAFSVSPQEAGEWTNGCASHDPAETVQIVIEGGQVNIQSTLPPMPTETPKPEPTSVPPTAMPADTPRPEPTAIPPTDVPTDTPSPTVPAEVQLNHEDDGRQIELVTGQILVITLASNPSTGYAWEVAEVDAAILQQIGESEFQPDPNAAEGMVGTGGVEIFRFEVAGAGQTTLNLVYRRPWATDVDPAETFSIQVVVR